MPVKVHLPDGRIVNFPDGMPPDQVEAAVSQLSAPEQAAPERSWTDTAVDALPAVGGALGGLIGGIGGTVAGMGVGGVPGAVGGAALGGGAGEAARQLVNRARGVAAPESMGAAAQDIGLSGAVQGGATLAGGAIGKGLRMVGHGVYKAALRPSAALSREFGDVAATGVKEGIPVSRGGALRTSGLRSASAKQADSLIAEAEQSGAPNVSTNAVVSRFGDVAAEARKRASLGMADDSADVAARAASIHRKFPGGIKPTEAQELKRTAQKSADTAFRTQERGGTIRGVDAQLDKATATGLRHGIEQVAPGVGAVNQRTQALGGLSNAMDTATARNLILERLLIPTATGVSSGMATGDVKTGLGTAALTAGLTSPGMLSRLAIGADRMGGHQIPDQVIRAALALMMQSQPKP